MSLLSSNLMAKALSSLLVSLSPVLLAEIDSALVRFRASAKKSASPWDDILCDLLESLLSGLPVNRN